MCIDNAIIANAEAKRRHLNDKVNKKRDCLSQNGQIL